MNTTTTAIPDDVKTNAISDATAAAGSLLTSVFSQTEHGQVGTIVNFTPYDWKLVSGFGQPVGGVNSAPQWEKAASAFSGYDSAAEDQNAAHKHAANFTTFALGGHVGIGTTKYSGGFCFYSAEAQMNLFVAIGFENFALLGITGSDHIAMAFFIDGSEVHGDLAGFNTKVNNALTDTKSGDFTNLKQLGDGLGYSHGTPVTVRYGGFKVQFTAAKEAVFVLELDK